MSASARLSVRLQDIAQSLAEVLDEVAGEPVAFVLVLQADQAAQYVSNASRQDGRELLQSLMERAMNNENCPTHRVPMVERPSNLQTAEQRWCGKWYDCPACANSMLVQSAELLAHLAPKNVAQQAALFM